MLIRHRGHDPDVDATAYVAPNATLVGRVVVGPRARIMYGSVLDAESSRIDVGEACIVAENAVLRASRITEVDRRVVLGDHVFVGPHATLLGCEVERCAYLAAGVTVLHGAHVGSGTSVAVGALVHANSVIPRKYFVPPQALAAGDPVRIVPPSRPDEMAAAVQQADFARTAFGVDARWEDRIRRYEQSTEARVAEFAAHAEDRILEA